MENNCVMLTFHKESLCGITPIPIHYTAGEIMLVGNIPLDGSWHGKHFAITGHIIEVGACTVLYVDKASPCMTPSPSMA